MSRLRSGDKIADVFSKEVQGSYPDLYVFGGVINLLGEESYVCGARGMSGGAIGRHGSNNLPSLVDTKHSDPTLRKENIPLFRSVAPQPAFKVQKSKAAPVLDRKLETYVRSLPRTSQDSSEAIQQHSAIQVQEVEHGQEKAQSSTVATAKNRQRTS